jgi:hypothetical protein
VSKIATETTDESFGRLLFAWMMPVVSDERKRQALRDSCVREHSSEPLPAVHPPLSIPRLRETTRRDYRLLR